MKLQTLLLAGTTLAASAGFAAAQDLSAEVFSSWTSGSELAAVEAIKSEFEARGGTWEYSSIAGFENANAAFQNRLMAGDPPTAKQLNLGKDAEAFVQGGMMKPITAVAEAQNWADAVPSILMDGATYDGEVYLAPVSIHGLSWMFYSKPAFEKAGIDGEPQSWDEFFEDMDTLKAADITPIAWGGQAWQEVKVFNMILLTQVGLEDFMKIFAEHDEEAIRSEGVRNTLEILGRMRDYVDGGAPGRNWNDASAMVIEGTAGVQFMGDWAKGEFTGAGLEPDVDFGCAMVPGTPGMIYISDAIGFPKQDGSEAAQDLLAEVILDPEVQVAFSLNKGSMPVRTDIDASGFDVCSQKGLEMLSAGTIVPEHAHTLSPERVGMLTDFVGEFFADPDADIDESIDFFAEVFE